MSLNESNRKILLGIARCSIENGFATGYPLCVNLREFPAALRKPAATFVTLEKNKQLRGCIGMLEAILPLAEDVAENAYSAAFKDPRFPPLTESDMDDLEIHISVLSEPEPIVFNSEKDLLDKLRPHTDGLILKDGPHHGTFLPAVWDKIEDRKEFLKQLKTKAGLPQEYWSDSLRVFRYTTEIIK